MESTTEITPKFLRILKLRIEQYNNGWTGKKRIIKGFGLDRLKAAIPSLESKEKNTLVWIVSEMDATVKEESVRNSDTVQSLAAVLFEQTKMLKEEFLTKTAKFAKEQYSLFVKMNAWDYAQWKEAYPVKSLSGTTLNKKGANLRDQASSVVRTGYDFFLERELKWAEIQYTNSIEKLAMRLEKKGITNSAEFTITTARIGINIETTIKHKDGKITRAWTIVASGPVQRPHYRYLIK